MRFSTTKFLLVVTVLLCETVPMLAWNVLGSRRNFLSTSTAAATSLVAGGAALLGAPSPSEAITTGGKVKYGDESIMIPKAHGTSDKPVQSDLLYGVDTKLADQICNYNRRFAERAGYFRYTSLEDAVAKADGQPITFYDSVTGKPLFVAPINRSPQQFIEESIVHGWPSFRDDEVVWDNVRILRSSGETVSVDGTHLGHNLPDGKGNRYCINLVSIAGKPSADSSA